MAPYGAGKGGRATDIYFVRHGQTDWNITWKLQGRADIPINARGRQQAAALRTRLAGCDAGRGVCLAAVPRAAVSAYPAVRAQMCPSTRSPPWPSRDFGAYEGCERKISTSRHSGTRRCPCPAPGAEPAGEFYARVQGFLRALGRGPGSVLLVAHRGGVSIPVQMFVRGVQSLGPGGQYVPLILPHGRVLHFTVSQQKGQKA